MGSRVKKSRTAKGSRRGWSARALHDPAAMRTEIAKLADLDLEGLQTRWRELVGNDPPPGLRRDFLCRALVYQVQTEVSGGLDRETASTLDRLAAGDKDAIAIQVTDQRRLKPGTLLVREWQGQLHRVMVLNEGFTWGGRSYTSLTAVACAIAGTKWNGHAFFGLTSGHVKSGPSKVTHG